MEGLAGIEPTLKGPQPSVQNRYTSDPNKKSQNCPPRTRTSIY